MLKMEDTPPLCLRFRIQKLWSTVAVLQKTKDTRMGWIWMQRKWGQFGRMEMMPVNTKA